MRRASTINASLVKIGVLVLALVLQVAYLAFTHSSWYWRFEELNENRYSRVIPSDDPRGFRPTWGSVASLLLPEEGSPWTFDRVEVVQGVVFDESSTLEAADGFERGDWAEVSMEEGGERCRVRFARARRWEGVLHFSSESGGEYALPVKVHAPWNDLGFPQDSGLPFEEGLILLLLFALAKEAVRMKRVVAGAGSADGDPSA